MSIEEAVLDKLRALPPDRQKEVLDFTEALHRRVTTDHHNLLKDNRDQILAMAARHGARNVRVFGSFARGEAGPDSDVDFLVEMEEGRSLMDIGALVMDLEELLGRRVQVAEPTGLHSYLKDRVLKEARPL